MPNQNGLNSRAAYTVFAKWLHWVMSAMILVMIILGWTMDGQKGVELAQSLSFHATGGILLFGFLILRISWRIGNPPSALPVSMSKRQRTAAHGVHIFLYVMMFLVPLTGLIAGVAHELPIVAVGGFNIQDAFSLLGREGFDLKREIHAQAMHILVALVIGHIGAAFMHQFWFKDGLMRRMLTERET